MPGRKTMRHTCSISNFEVQQIQKTKHMCPPTPNPPPGGLTDGPGGRKDRADGRKDRADGRTGRTEGPSGRKDQADGRTGRTDGLGGRKDRANAAPGPDPRRCVLGPGLCPWPLQCMHKSVVHAQECCACARILCMHKNLCIYVT